MQAVRRKRKGKRKKESTSLLAPGELCVDTTGIVIDTTST